MRPVVLSALLLAGCGAGSSDPCPGSARTLEILEPADGETVTEGSFDAVVLACNFDLADMIVLRALEPVESDYAFFSPTGRVSEMRREGLPVIPGTTMRFRAQSTDGTVQSAEVSITTGAR